MRSRVEGLIVNLIVSLMMDLVDNYGAKSRSTLIGFSVENMIWLR